MGEFLVQYKQTHYKSGCRVAYNWVTCDTFLSEQEAIDAMKSMPMPNADKRVVGPEVF